jgi:hypothetical protein
LLVLFSGSRESASHPPGVRPALSAHIVTFHFLPSPLPPGPTSSLPPAPSVFPSATTALSDLHGDCLPRAPQLRPNPNLHAAASPPSARPRVALTSHDINPSIVPSSNTQTLDPIPSVCLRSCTLPPATSLWIYRTQEITPIVGRLRWRLCTPPSVDPGTHPPSSAPCTLAAEGLRWRQPLAAAATLARSASSHLQRPPAPQP